MTKIPLHDRDGNVSAFALVDDGDVALVTEFSWSLDATGYAISKDRARRTIRMHRVVLGLATGVPLLGDHINGDRLDNRRSNLRVVTNAQNRQNLNAYRGSSSTHRGVAKSGKKWRAYSRLNGVLHYLGEHDDELVAASVAAAFRAEHMPFSQEALPS